MVRSAIHDALHVLPMVQRVPKSGDDLPRSGQFYYIHALPEDSVDRLISNYKLLAMVRGIPSNSQCSPVAASCLLGIQERVLSVLRKRYEFMAMMVPDNLIAVMLATIPHYLKRRTMTQVHVTRENQLLTHLPSLPDDVAQLDEAVAFVVWLGSADEISESIYSNFVTADAAAQPFKIGGIPLELYSSVTKCKDRPLYGDTLTSELSISRVGNIRPGVPIREILHRLHLGDPTHFHHNLRDLEGIYVLPPSAHIDNGRVITIPSQLISMWTSKLKSIPITYITNSAAISSTGNLMSLISLSRADMYGRSYISKLQQAYSVHFSKETAPRAAIQQESGKGGRFLLRRGQGRPKGADPTNTKSPIQHQPKTPLKTAPRPPQHGSAVAQKGLNSLSSPMTWAKPSESTLERSVNFHHSTASGVTTVPSVQVMTSHNIPQFEACPNHTPPEPPSRPPIFSAGSPSTDSIDHILSHGNVIYSPEIVPGFTSSHTDTPMDTVADSSGSPLKNAIEVMQTRARKTLGRTGTAAHRENTKKLTPRNSKK